MKKVLFGLAVAMAASCAHASYLFWQISDSTLKTGSFNGNTITGYRVVALDSNTPFSYTPGAAEGYTALNTTYATYSAQDGWGWSDAATIVSPAGATGNAYANLSGYTDNNDTSYTYYIEVMSDSTVIGVSSGLSYADAISQGRLVNDLSSMAASVKAWTGGSYAAPEPTSGLLLLVGGALLALRRRRA